MSNFSIKTLSSLLSPGVSVVPAVNQVELHPFLPQHALLEFCKDRGIHLTAYSPVGKNELSGDDELVKIAQTHQDENASVAQVLLSWAIQRGTSVVPKTVNEGRMKENLSVSVCIRHSSPCGCLCLAKSLPPCFSLRCFDEVGGNSHSTR